MDKNDIKEKMTIEDGLDEIRKEDELEQLKREKKKAEEKAEELRIKLDCKQQEVTDLSRMMEDYKRELDSKEYAKDDEIIKSHLRGMMNFWPGEPKDETDKGIIKFITNQEFIEIYKNASVLKTSTSKLEYITMKAIETGAANMMNFQEFIERLAPLGLNMTCPYRIKKEDSISGTACTIDGKPVDAACNGSGYENCKCFTETTKKFATGEKDYVKPPKAHKAPEFNIDENEKTRMEPRLMDEIEKYWRDD